MTHRPPARGVHALDLIFFRVPLPARPWPIFKGVVLFVIALKVVHAIYQSWKLDQLDTISCDKALAHYRETGAQSGPLDHYCIGLYEKSKQPRIALDYFKKAADAGLFLGKEEVCRPSLYSSLKVEHFSDTLKAELEAYCCPKKSLALCPWHPVEQDRLSKGDDSTNAQRIFW